MTKIVFKDYKNIKQSIDFLLNNENMIAVNKPAHLPVIPDRLGRYNYNLRDIVQKHLQKDDPSTRLFVVHRIDADTTGVVLLCKNEMYHKQLNVLFEKREIGKYYLALVKGHLPEKTGTIDKPILKTSKKMIIHDKGKPSQTEYQVMEEFENFSLLRLKPLTGRTHQLRVHLKSVGCPLIVDPLYGKSDAFNLQQIKRNYHSKKQQQPKPLSARLTLHAQKIEFGDPLSVEQISIEAPVPKDFMAVLKALRKYNVSHSRATGAEISILKD